LVATHFPNTKECQYVADTATAAAAVPATTAVATAAAKEKDHHNKKEQTDYKSYFSGTQFTRSEFQRRQVPVHILELTVLMMVGRFSMPGRLPEIMYGRSHGRL
jgi:hypothetical protein